MVQNLGHIIVPSTMLLSLQGMHFNDAMRKNPERPKIRILNVWQKKYIWLRWFWVLLLLTIVPLPM